MENFFENMWEPGTYFLSNSMYFLYSGALSDSNKEILESIIQTHQVMVFKNLTRMTSQGVFS